MLWAFVIIYCEPSFNFDYCVVFSLISDNACLKDSAEVDTGQLEALVVDAFKRQISALEREKKELQIKYKGKGDMKYS